MKKPSERINEISSDLYDKIKNGTPFSQHEIATLTQNAIIHYLDELFVGLGPDLKIKEGWIGEMKNHKCVVEYPTVDEPVHGLPVNADFQIQYNAGWNDSGEKILERVGKILLEIPIDIISTEKLQPILDRVVGSIKELKK